MGGGQADKNEVDLMVDAGLTHRLTTIQVITEHGEVAGGKELMMSRDPPFGRGGFTIPVSGRRLEDE